MAKRNSNNMGLLGGGYLPPQDQDAESVLLGTILSDSNALIMVKELLSPEIFYYEPHKIICEAIITMESENKAIDIITVSAQLRKMEQLEAVGGNYFITMLTSRVASSANIREHIIIVHHAFLLREQIRFFQEQIQKCYKGFTTDPMEVISDTANFLTQLQQKSNARSEKSMHELVKEAMDKREKGSQIDDSLPSGIDELDKELAGFLPGDFIVIAARPAMGKTTVALGIAKAIALEKKVPVAFFSLEMTANQLTVRLEASVSGLKTNDIKNNNLTDAEKVILFEADGKLSNSNIWIDDTSALDIDVFRAKAAIMKHKYGIGAIVIDYIQLMKSPKKSFSPEVEIADISGKLKSVAKQLNIPVIGLSQLSREVEKRPNKMPQLSDLRQSGSLEQDADKVLFLLRPAYYPELADKPVPFRKFNMELETRNLLVMIIAKNREGETGAIPADLNLSNMQMKNHPALTHKSLPPAPQQQQLEMNNQPPNLKPPF